MRKSILIGMAVMALGSAAQAAAPVGCNAAVVADFVDLFYHQRKVAQAFDAHVASDYIQHNPQVGQGRQAAVDFLTPMFARPNFSALPVRVSIDDDLASVLLKVTIDGQVKAVVQDLYRLQDCKIVEHWDIKDEIAPADADRFFPGLETPAAKD